MPGRLLHQYAPAGVPVPAPLCVQLDTIAVGGKLLGGLVEPHEVLEAPVVVLGDGRVWRVHGLVELACTRVRRATKMVPT